MLTLKTGSMNRMEPINIFLEGFAQMVVKAVL